MTKMTDTFTPVGPYRASDGLIFDANSIPVMAVNDYFEGERDWDGAAFIRHVADALNAAEAVPAPRKLKPLDELFEESE